MLGGRMSLSEEPRRPSSRVVHVYKLDVGVLGVISVPTQEFYRQSSPIASEHCEGHAKSVYYLCEALELGTCEVYV